jgi:membrane-associated protease RseP (regulator of RpoE activity)
MNSTIGKVALAAVLATLIWWQYPGIFVSALIFIAALSVLVAFHEAGHFIAAKACGVYVDRFSIGMPPRLFGVRWGETDYCIGALPLGGYVKMAGQEDAPRSEEEQQADYADIPPDRWFSNKPVWQRIIILVAGPAANVVLAALIYAIVAGVGAQVEESRLEARVGKVERNSPAESAPLFAWPEGADRPDFTREPDGFGWQTGDRILSVGDRRVQNMMEVAQTAMFRKDAAVEVVLVREDLDGQAMRYLSPAQPEIIDDDFPLPRFGVMHFQTVMISGVMPGSPADEAGILPGDVIVATNGRRVDVSTFTESVQRTPDGQSLAATVDRDGDLLELQLFPQVVGSLEGVNFLGESDPFGFLQGQDLEVRRALGNPPLPAGSVILSLDGDDNALNALETAFYAAPMSPIEASVRLPRNGERTVSVSPAALLGALTGVDEESAPMVSAVTNEMKETHGLLPQDIIAKVNGEPATPGRLRAVLNENIGGSVTLDIHRTAIGGGVLRGEDRFAVEVPVEASGKVGVMMGPRLVYHRFPVSQILPQVIHEMRGDFILMYETLSGLVTAQVSPRELGGPIMIAQITTTMAQRGWVWLFEITALISINLAVINLLPLPVLDGGQVVMNLVEAIRRKPIDLRVQEKIQFVGICLLLTLMVAVTYNDISRIITGFIPR